MLAVSVAFDPANPPWAEIPASAGIFALFGADDKTEPYISRTPNLRHRLRRLLIAKQEQTKRLRLTQGVARIEYSLTGSEFEAWMVLYAASLTAFGERARKRLHLKSPVLLRMAMENAYPRVYVTSRITRSAAANLFGPFPSRIAAENILESVLNLFDLRRCTDDLNPDPEFPGCVYSEMKKCLAPCFKGCTDERYAEEAQAVWSFLATRGQSLLQSLTRERDQAAEEMQFERAAEIHGRLMKVEASVSGIPEAVRALTSLNGILAQPSREPESVALFLLKGGNLYGPAHYSVAGMRHQNEQSGSSSLFAHPTTLQAVPLDESGNATVKLAARDELEARLDVALAALTVMAGTNDRSPQQTADNLCLFSRWYYRPQAKRVGDILFTEAGEVAKKALLRMISRVYRQNLLPAASETASTATVPPSPADTLSAS